MTQEQLLEKDVEALRIGGVSGSLPSFNEMLTAAIDYREDSDEYDDDDMIKGDWSDKQEAFMAGIRWILKNCR